MVAIRRIETILSKGTSISIFPIQKRRVPSDVTSTDRTKLYQNQATAAKFATATATTVLWAPIGTAATNNKTKMDSRKTNLALKAKKNKTAWWMRQTNAKNNVRVAKYQKSRSNFVATYRTRMELVEKCEELIHRLSHMSRFERWGEDLHRWFGDLQQDHETVFCSYLMVVLLDGRLVAAPALQEVCYRPWLRTIVLQRREGEMKAFFTYRILHARRV